MTFKAVVITVSDSAARGERQDASGPAVAEQLTAAGFQVVHREVIADEQDEIISAITGFALNADLIVTTGGTGIAPRDVTPEATRLACSREVPGIAERMRAVGAEHTPYAALSRGICAVRGQTLVLNLPGSPQGAVESLAAVVELLPHALRLLRGETGH